MATKLVGGFIHLAGESVTVSLSGYLHMGGTAESDQVYTNVSTQTVSAAGEVSVEDRFYGNIMVGLPFTMRIRTLPVSYEAAAASRGAMKNISKVFIRANGGGTMQVGTDDSGMVPMLVELSGEDEIAAMQEVPVMGDWNNDASLLIEHTGPEAVVLQSMVLDLVTGG